MVLPIALGERTFAASLDGYSKRTTALVACAIHRRACHGGRPNGENRTGRCTIQTLNATFVARGDDIVHGARTRTWIIALSDGVRTGDRRWLYVIDGHIE